MNDLRDIGFYTLSNERAQKANETSPLSRCELLLTDRCNFRCSYCRGLRSDCRGDLPLEQALECLRYWIADGLRAVRFSGGEPTMYEGLPVLVTECKKAGVAHIAISTNGSQSLAYYQHLIRLGVNDFSISLDSGCCAVSEAISGKVGSFPTVTQNIKELARLVYVTVGMVFTETNIDTCVEDVLFAASLQPHDIRVIPAAQYNKALLQLTNLPDDVRAKYPILDYRINNIEAGLPVRGLLPSDPHSCPLVLDDTAVAGTWHFPCIIYLREGGAPIGRVSSHMREERAAWYQAHDSQNDAICSRNCLDVCIAYNRAYEGFNQ